MLAAIAISFGVGVLCGAVGYKVVPILVSKLTDTTKKL